MATILLRSFLLTLIGLNLGCASKSVDPSETSAIRVEKMPSELVQIPWVTVSQEEGGVVVAGAVRRWPQNRAVIAGHVDVTVLDESGQVLAKLRAPYTPSGIPQAGSRSSLFRARIDPPAQPGLMIRVAHDNQSPAACSLDSASLNRERRAFTAAPPMRR